MDYLYDSNTIHAEPLIKLTGVEFKIVHHKIHTLLNDRGLQPSLHILDNEFPNVIKTFMRKVNGKFQLIPPHTHRRYSEERSIRTFKENYVVGLASTHKDLSLNIWCRLIPHASLTIDLLWQSHMKPILSGYA